MNEFLKNLSYRVHQNHVSMELSFGLKHSPSENVSNVDQGDMVNKLRTGDHMRLAENAYRTFLHILVCS